MKDEIIIKLERFLLDHLPFSEECHVVYLMVEIRKFLEHADTDAKHQTLRLFCNWVLHTIIDKTKLSDEFRAFIERIEESISNGAKFENGQFVPDDFGRALNEFASLAKLKNCLKTFLEENYLRTDILGDDNWKNFRDLLLKILAEQPLVLLKNPTINIHSFCFKYATSGAAILEIIYKDGSGPYRYIGMF